MWVLLAGLLGLWLIGAIAISSPAGAASILVAMTAVAVGVHYWERHHRTRV